MKLSHTLLGALACMFVLTACVSEDMPENNTGVQSKNQGKLALGVEAQEPKAATTKASGIDTQVFPVIIYKEDGVTVVKSYNKLSEVPNEIMLEVGNYKIESHTPGEAQRYATEPYYKGVKPMTILKNVTTKETVTCKMINTSVKVQYDPTFIATFNAWSLTIDDGADGVVTYTNTQGSSPSIVYWLLGDGVKSLQVNFRGKTTEGNIVSASSVLTKDQASEKYDEDREDFTGGDALVLNLTPVESTNGQVTGIGITANVTFVETGDTVGIIVTDNDNFEPGGGTDPETPETPGDSGEDVVQLTIPAPVTIPADDAATADPSTGDVKISCSKGIKSIRVVVTSSSDEMMEQLAAVAVEYEGVDLVNGCEVVGNDNLVSFLASLNKTITVPAEGEKNYTFPVGQFYLFLGILPGEHHFSLTVKDMEDNVKSGVVDVTITE